MDCYDLLVIGGGINGAGIARDAAGRGLSVLLCDQGDFGGATSSASSKLAHGGLRYLEYYAVALVREALRERELLLEAAPHLVRPLQFVLPSRGGAAARWRIRAGLFLYDRLGGERGLGASRQVRLAGDPLGEGLDPRFDKGFAYWDCRVDDARLVIVNLMAAAALGAQVLPRTACVNAQRLDGRWRATLEDRSSGQRRHVAVRAVVDAAGPWADAVWQGVLGLEARLRLRLVQGSHIIVPRLNDGNHALTLRTEDRRVVFVIPFEGAYSLVGTTERPIDSMAEPLAVGDDEVDYLCRAVSRYLETPLEPAQVVWRYAGVRPLVDDGEAESRAVSRDCRLILDRGPSFDTGQPVGAALGVFGGKLTSYRHLAERAVDALAPCFPGMGGGWTEAAALPGGDLPAGDFDGFLAALSARYDWMPSVHLAGLARRHGTLAAELLGDARGQGELGRYFGAGLYERELVWFREREWAMTAEDMLWRRSKAGLHLPAAARQEIGAWLGRPLGRRRKAAPAPEASLRAAMS